MTRRFDDRPGLDPDTLDRAAVDGTLLQAKGDRTVSVCIPARNEEGTVAHVVERVGGAWLAGRGGTGLVDQLVVVDDGSLDATASVARSAGAEVVDHAGPHGKGRAMAAGVMACRGDVVVFLDADVIDFDPRFVSRLAAPLLLDDHLCLVKGFYRRPLAGAPTGGGRVTELVARPLLELLYPELAHIRQPLAGETALPRGVLEKLVLEPGYGVELGLLVDVRRAFGPGTIAQVDLGRRVHRNRPLDELRPQAADVLRAALDRRRLTDPES